MTFAGRAAAFVLLAVACSLAPARAASRVEGDAILFDGRIDNASAREFLDLLWSTAQVDRLVITSGGGLVGPALDMANAIADRGLDIEVPTQCHSSCANYLFPAARRKVIGRPGAVAWHGNMAHVLYLQATGRDGWNDELVDEARRLRQREDALYARIGVDGFLCWFGKVAPFEVEEFYEVSPAGLALFGVRDVELREIRPPASKAGIRRLDVDPAQLEAMHAKVRAELAEPLKRR